jgi:CHAT domain-containing protein/Tfp pilus assembly protein PilF
MCAPKGFISLLLIGVLIVLIQSDLYGSDRNPGPDTTKAHAAYSAALRLMDEGNYREAKELLEEASTLFKKKKCWERSIACDVVISNAWSASSDRSGLSDFFSETLELSKERMGPDHVLTGDCFNRLGELYYLDAKYELARKQLDEAYRVYSSLSDEESLKKAKVYTNYARINIAVSEYDSVENYLDKALDLQLSLLDSLDNRLTITYHSYATFYYHIGKIDQSIHYRKLVLQIERNKYGESHREVADCYNNLGASYMRKGDFHSALESHQKALDIRKASLDSLHPYIPLSLNNLGNVYSSLGDYETSNSYHFEALRLRRKIFDENHRDIAMSYTNLGTNYFHTDQPKKASFYLKKVVPIMESIHGPEHMLTADAYENAGLPYYLTGQLDSAFHFFYKALAIREKSQGGVNIKVARSYNNIGAIYKENRDYDLALSYYFKSMEIYKDLLGENSYSISSSCNNIGEVYYLTDKLEESLEYYRKSLEIEIAHLGPENPGLASNYLNLGSSLADLGKFEESSRYNKKALQLQIEAYGEKNYLVASIYANMAVNYEELDSLDKALEFMEKAIQIREEVSGLNDPDLASEYTRYGMMLGRKGQTDQGLAYLHKGLSVNYFGDIDPADPRDIDPTKLKDGNLFIETLASLIEFNNEFLSSGGKGELENLNLPVYELIADLSISLRQTYRFEKSKLYALKQWDYLYSKGFETATNLYSITGDESYFNKAFRFAGLKKASALTDAILVSQALKNAGIPEHLVQKEEVLNVEMEGLRQSLMELDGESDSPDDSKGDSKGDSQDESEKIRSQINSIVIQLNALYLTIEEEYPDYKRLRSSYPDYAPDEIGALLDPATLLLDFVVTDSVVHAIVISSEGRWIESIEVPADLESRVNELLRATKKYRVADFISLSNEMYGFLMAPLEKYFQGIEKIVTIPESYLLLLPFDILVCNKEGKNGERAGKTSELSELDFFVKRFETVTHYSSDLWVRSLQKSSTVSLAPDLKEFLGFAPVFNAGPDMLPLPDTLTGPDMLYADRSVMDRMSLQPLPYSMFEVDSLVGMFTALGRSAKGLTQSEASEENFRQVSGNYRYIHIATHGLINPEKPELSGLIFWSGEDETDSIPQLLIAAKRDDGILYTKEVYSLDLKADLVTLSACETGAGTLVKGEGLLSFVRGFTYAGVPNMLISYWKLNDKTTTGFMLDFYKGVLSGDPYSTALRKAKLSAISNASTAFPATWGNFVLIGH